MLPTIKASKMSGKLAGIGAINVSPFWNRFCEMANKIPNTSCSVCYSRSMLRTFRKTAEPKFAENGRKLSEGEVDLSVAGLEQTHIRLNAHGELLNEQHFDNYMRICTAYPRKVFALWTKRHKLVEKWLGENERPENLILVFSSFYLNRISPLPKHFDKVFTVWDDMEKLGIDRDINCQQKCTDCMKCYTVGEPTIQINERRK